MFVQRPTNNNMVHREATGQRELDVMRGRRTIPRNRTVPLIAETDDIAAGALLDHAGELRHMALSEIGRYAQASAVNGDRDERRRRKPDEPHDHPADVPRSSGQGGFRE